MLVGKHERSRSSPSNGCNTFLAQGTPLKRILTSSHYTTFERDDNVQHTNRYRQQQQQRHPGSRTRRRLPHSGKNNRAVVYSGRQLSTNRVATASFRLLRRVASNRSCPARRTHDRHRQHEQSSRTRFQHLQSLPSRTAFLARTRFQRTDGMVSPARRLLRSHRRR